MVIWIIGLSGAGKTTIGRKLRDRLAAMGRPVVFFDGDIFRNIMGDDLGHTIEERKKNAQRICRFCQYLEKQGIDVVFALLSLFPESQEWNRKNLSQYFEVYLDVSMDTVMKRDPKGLYKKALAGEITHVVGVDINFEPPLHPDLVVNNDDERVDHGGIVDAIMEGLEEKKLIQSPL
ncbi:MAG TPA: adenylyl-sulfate kinase [Candidatus Omnitrophota bacterium]|nr:adenylyl-sulfate kinase [Candidatus Omnitrophota bacterium]